MDERGRASEARCGRRPWRNDAPWGISGQARWEQSRALNLRHGSYQRTPSASLRSEHSLSRCARKGRPHLFGNVARRSASGNCRTARPSLVYRCSVPSRAQEPPVRTASVICRIHRGSRQAEPSRLISSFGTRPAFDRYAGDTREEYKMLLTIAIILLILWALGFFAFHVAGGLIHMLLVIGIIVLIWNFVAGRRAV